MGNILRICCRPRLIKTAVRSKRERALVNRLLSAGVQVPIPATTANEHAHLSDDQVVQVFTKHVPDILNFRYRGKSGGHTCIVKFLPTTYRNGLSAFHGQSLNSHLTNLFRLIVHHGQRNGPNACRYLTEIAEAFMDCQAVQARAIERIGLQIQGITEDLRGLLVRMIGEYKALAVIVYSDEFVRRNFVKVDATHYSSRVTTDLAQHLGLNQDDARRAALDEISNRRCPPLSEKDRRQAASRCRQLFDLPALLDALVAEIGNFGPESGPNSLPMLFIDWSGKCLSKPHLVLDEDTVSKAEINRIFARAMLEDIFMGKPQAPMGERYRGDRICDLFRSTPVEDDDSVDESESLLANDSYC